jgi:hypothetical protein
LVLGDVVNSSESGNVHIPWYSFEIGKAIKEEENEKSSKPGSQPHAGLALYMLFTHSIAAAERYDIPFVVMQLPISIGALLSTRNRCNR